MQVILALYARFRNLILYGIIGGFSAGIDFLTFYALTTFGDVFYLVANIISVSVGISISFILNKKYNFKVNDKVLKRFLIFITVGLTGMLFSSVLLYIFIDMLEMEQIISKFLSIVFVVLIQFFVNKLVTFKKEL
jgi:putative flippase GtrA